MAVPTMVTPPRGTSRRDQPAECGRRTAPPARRRRRATAARAALGAGGQLALTDRAARRPECGAVTRHRRATSQSPDPPAVLPARPFISPDRAEGDVRCPPQRLWHRRQPPSDGPSSVGCRPLGANRSDLMKAGRDLAEVRTTNQRSAMIEASKIGP